MKISREDLLGLIIKHYAILGRRVSHGMVLAVCMADFYGKPEKEFLDFEGSEDELIEKIKSVAFIHKPSEPGEDEEFWFAVNPFDGMKYELSASNMAGWPSTVHAA